MQNRPEQPGAALHGKLYFHILLGLVCVFVIGGFASLTGAEYTWSSIIKSRPWSAHFTDPETQIFWQIRLPRILTGCLAGASLALCGLTLQSILRNPLAEPYILGISAGAALGKSFAIFLLPAGLLFTPFAVQVLCFVFALLPLLMLEVFSIGSRGFSSTTMLLAGVMLNIIISAILLVLQAFAPPEQARQMQLWWLGGLDVVGYQLLIIAVPLAFIAGFVLLRRMRVLNLLSLDDSTAFHLGVDVHRETRLLLWSCTLLVSSVVAISGPIAFVGLIVPHLLRSLFGADNRLLGPLCVVYGAAFLLFCDLAGWRGPGLLHQFGLNTLSVEVPVGVVTSLLGGPLFLLLLFKASRNEP